MSTVVATGAIAARIESVPDPRPYRLLFWDCIDWLCGFKSSTADGGKDVGVHALIDALGTPDPDERHKAEHHASR